MKNTTTLHHYLLVAFVILLITQTTAAEWWNNSWTRCRNITVTDNSDKSIDSWHFQHNFTGLTFSNDSEIRIISEACNDGGYELPSYVLSSSPGADNATATVLWYGNVSANSSDIWSIYYDNNGASAASYTTGMTSDTGNQIIRYDGSERFDLDGSTLADVTVLGHTHESPWNQGVISPFDNYTSRLDKVTGSCTNTVNDTTYIKYECSSGSYQMDFEFYAYNKIARLSFDGFGSTSCIEHISGLSSGTKHIDYRGSTDGNYSLSSGEVDQSHEAYGVYAGAKSGDSESFVIFWDFDTAKNYDNSTNMYTRSNDIADPRGSIFSTTLGCGYYEHTGVTGSLDAMSGKMWVGVVNKNTTVFENFYKRLTTTPTISVGSEQASTTITLKTGWNLISIPLIS